MFPRSQLLGAVIEQVKQSRAEVAQVILELSIESMVHRSVLPDADIKTVYFYSPCSWKHLEERSQINQKILSWE